MSVLVRDKCPRIRVGTVLASISRNAGGLFTSVRRPAQECEKDHGINAQIWAGFDEYTDSDLASWLPIAPTVLNTKGPRNYGFMPGLVREMSERGLDLIHSHGLWMYPGTAARKAAKNCNIPHVVSPRGMLDPWAIRTSRLKKFIASYFYEDANLGNAACIHALCESEAKAIREYGVKAPICIIPNGIDLPKAKTAGPSVLAGKIEEGRRIALFLGRLHPKKGVHHLIDSWKVLCDENPKVVSEWALAIAGWGSGTYESDLRKQAEDLNLKNVHFCGALFGTEKDAAFSEADAFVLPSYSEGLPMAVLEAWSYGLPVVITRECNLPEGFQHQAAIEVRPNSISLAKGLLTLVGLSDIERQEIGERGRSLVRHQFSWEAIAEAYASMYLWLLGDDSRSAAINFY